MTDYEHEDIDDNRNTLMHWKELSSKEIIQIVCGLNFCACLSRNGDIYTWGNGMYGQLGHREQVVSAYEEFKVPRPIKIDNFSNGIYLCAGEECMACITRERHLYTWGKNFCGMLGHGDEKDVFEPKRVIGVTGNFKKSMPMIQDDDDDEDLDEDDDDIGVDNLEKEEVIHVSCGQSHMACVTAKNEIFTWGNNFLGPLGRILDTKQESDFYPHLVDLVQVGDLVTEDNLKQSDEVDFIQVECLKYNTIALTSDGRLFSCGKGGYEGGGQGEAPRTLLCIVQSLEGKRVKSVAKSSFATHTGAIVLNSDDDSKNREDFYIWGNNEDNKLGIPNLNDESLSIDEASLLHPKKFPFSTPRDCYMICCGETHTAVILKPHSSDKNPNADLTLEKFERGETNPNVSATTVKKESTKQIIEEEYDSESEDSKGDEDSDSEDEDEYASIKPTATIVTPASTSSEPEKKPASSSSSDVYNEPQKTTPTAVVNVDLSDDEEKPKPVSQPVKQTNKSSAVKELHGYLQKKGEKGLVKLWRKRWFNLEGNYLCYYEKEGVSIS